MWELEGLIDNALDGINANTGEKTSSFEAHSDSDFNATGPILKPTEFQYRTRYVTVVPWCSAQGRKICS
jgi:hypothetical protein